MMRLDVLTPRPRKDGKTFWLKIGAAFPRDQGGYSVVLDALPLADAEGRVNLLLSEPKPRDGGHQERRPQSRDLDDEIPF